MNGVRLIHCVVLSYVICIPGNVKGADDQIDLTKVYRTSPFAEQIFSNPNLFFKFSNFLLCSNSTIDNEKLCSCQPSCLSYSTCCLDYLWYKQKWDSIDAYLSFLVSKQTKSYSCVPIVRNRREGNINITVENISMVTTCPHNKTTTASSTIILPTYGSDQHVYMNPATAQCHGVDEYILLPLDISCQNTLDKNTKSNNLKDSTFTQCNYSVNEQAKEYVRQCSPQNTCQGIDGTSSMLNADACQSYVGKVEINKIVYENLHCSLCANTTNYDVRIWDSPLNRVFIPMPYSTVISLGSGPPTAVYDNKGNKIKITVDCKSNEIYDVITAECIPFICSKGYKQSGFKCIKSISTGNSNTDAGIEMWDDLKTRLYKCLLSAYHDAHVIVNVTKAKAEEVWDLLQTHDVTMKKKTQTLFTSSFHKKNQSNLQQIRDILSRNNYTEEEVIVSVVSVEIAYTKIYGSNVEHSFPENALCSTPAPLPINATIYLDSKCNLKVENEMFTPKQYVITSSNKQEYDLMTCNKYHLRDSCPRSNIPPANYTLCANGSVVLNNKTLLAVHEYTPTTRGVSVCINKYTTGQSKYPLKPKWVKTTELVEGYLTMVACVVSIIFYALTILVYLRTREFREIPGRNIACVCIALLFADVFVFVSSFVERRVFSCYIVAVILYFLLLCAQTWCTVVSFEIWFTLRKHTSARFIYSPKRFIWYCVYAFLVPLAITVTFSIADSTNTLHIGYGQADHCWIGNFYYRLYIYLVPVAIASGFNISVLLLIMYEIYHQQRKSKQLLHKTNGSDDIKIVTTALKLVLLLGVVEIVGFIELPRAKSTGVIAFNFVMRFLFTILRGFRGLFIWVLFVFMDKRAWDNFKCNNSGRSDSPQETPTMASKSSKASYKLTYNIRDTKL